MKKAISLSLILSLTSYLFIPLQLVSAFETNPSAETLTAQRRSGGGSRGGNRAANRSGGGNRTANRNNSVNRHNVGANGSGRVKKPSTAQRPSGQRPANRENLDVAGQRAGSGRINRDQAQNRPNNVNRDNASNRVNNVDRNNVRNRVDNNRNINVSNDRRYSNRVNRNTINTGNRNIIVNPRPNWGGWGWNSGVAWRPNYGYWGGGFWGGFAAGAVTAGVTAAVVSAANANNEPDYIIIQQNSPGYQLFDGYGLSQVQCVEESNLVYIYGPQDSLICATPNTVVTAGYYDVDPEGLTLIAR